MSKTTPTMGASFHVSAKSSSQAGEHYLRPPAWLSVGNTFDGSLSDRLPSVKSTPCSYGPDQNLDHVTIDMLRAANRIPVFKVIHSFGRQLIATGTRTIRPFAKCVPMLLRNLFKGNTFPLSIFRSFKNRSHVFEESTATGSLLQFE